MCRATRSALGVALVTECGGGAHWLIRSARPLPDDIALRLIA